MGSNLSQNEEHQIQALVKAKTNTSTANYQAIIAGFQQKGLNPEDIIPRQNVFTFNAWKALGRAVKKGEHGVKVTTWIEDKDEKKYPKTTTVFHLSQTQELNTGAGA